MIAACNLNVTEATARETKSQGDQVARHPRLLNRGGPTGRRRQDLNRETSRKPPQVEAPIPTRRKTSPRCESKDRQAETRGAEIEKMEPFSIPMLPEEWPSPLVEWKMAQKRRKSKTVKPAPTARNGQEPVHRHNLQNNSQARFCQLDTTVARRNRPVKSRRGLRLASERARQKKTCTSPPKPPRKGKSRRGQD